MTQIDYLAFLNSTNPDEIILAIFSDFGNENPEKALSQIIHRLQETKTDQTTLQNHFNQLRILARLPKLDLKFDPIIQNMAKYFEVGKAPFFIKVQEKEQMKVVTNLIQKLNLTFEQIADIAGTLLYFVKSVQRKLTSK